jgi:diacylglycerol kinase family enzyme
MSRLPVLPRGTANVWIVWAKEPLALRAALERGSAAQSNQQQHCEAAQLSKHASRHLLFTTSRV